MSSSNLCIYLPIQTDSQSLRLEDVFNGKVTLHITMLNGDDLSQVHVGTGSCLTIAVFSSSMLSFPSLFLPCHKFLHFATQRELDGYQQQQEESRRDFYCITRGFPREISHRLMCVHSICTKQHPLYLF